MNKCEINIVNGTPKVDRYPKLMESLLEHTSYNVTDAVNLYGISLNEDYSKMVQEPNNLEHFLRYVQTKNIENKKELNDKNKVYLNILLNQPNDELNFREEFNKTFSENGLFEYDYHKVLDSKLVLPDAEFNESALENIFYFINNSDAELNTYNTPIVTGDSLNLDDNLFDLKLAFANIMTKEGIIERAIELENNDVLENEETQNWLLEFNKNRTFIPKMYVTDSLELQPVGDSVYNRMSVSFDTSQNFNTITESIEFFVENIEELSISENIEDLENFTKKLETNLINKGFPVNNLSEALLENNLESVQNFMGSLYNFLKDVESLNGDINDSLYEFSLEYNNLFDSQKQPTVLEVDRNGDMTDVFHIKTNLSDAEMLSEFNLLSVGDNMYKIYTVVIGDYSSLYDESMRGDYLDNFSEFDDSDSVKVLTVVKSIEQVDGRVVELDSRYLREFNLDYEDFVTRFNKLLLKNAYLNSVFSFTENGIEAKKQIDSFNKNLLESFLDENTFRELQDYALISGNQSLENILPNFNPLFEKNDDVFRNYILNNKKNLLSLKSDYEKIGDTIVADGVSGNFIKVDGNIYERVEDNNFVKLENSVNKVFDAKKPKLIQKIETEYNSDNEVEVESGKTKQKFC